jgi:ribose-phosphate pyrophosphokinase
VKVFAPATSSTFAEAVCDRLGTAPARLRERDFDDGEHKIRPLEPVRGDDVYVIHSLYGEPGQSVNDKLCRLIFLLGALRDAGAGRLTAVIPYLAYARKDRKTKSRDPVTTRYVAGMLESSGLDRVVTLDVHNLAAYQNAFRCRSEHLEAKRLFVEHIRERIGDEPVAVVSPDVGGVKRATAFREALEEALGREVCDAFINKKRSRDVVSGDTVVGDVEDRVAILLDDLISTGTTLARAAGACRELGARRVFAAATHGLLVDPASEKLAVPALDGVIVTDSVAPLGRITDAFAGRLTTLSVAPLIGDAIRCLHENGSLVRLLGEEED